MRIFLSYRHIDSTQFAAQCFEYLTARFGARSVFWDQESIADDSDWKQSICARLDASDAVLCIVGTQWNSLLQQRRNDSSDCVRFELEYAARLRRPVVVVLIDGAAAPTAEQLPESLKFLAIHQAAAFDSASQSDSFRHLVNRLNQFAPQVAAPRAWSQAEAARRPWVDRGLHAPPLHSAWWQHWNLHDPNVVQRITDVLSEQSAEHGVVLLVGSENSGRRYLVNAAVRNLRATHQNLQLLRINLDGYELKSREPQEKGPLEAYLRYQARRLGIHTGGEKQHAAELDQLCKWLKAKLDDGVSSVNTCACVGMLLELSGSLAAVLRILRGVSLRPAVLARTRLLVCVLEHFAGLARTIVHVEESSVDQLLRDDLVSLCLSKQQLRLVFSAFPDVDQTYLLGQRPTIRIDVPAFDGDQLQRVLDGRFGANAVPVWLPRLLQQQARGNRGLTALQLLELFQDDAVRWDGESSWVAGPGEHAAALPASLSRLLQPLDRLFQDTPHLESLLRLAALCGELIPLTLLLDFLQISADESEELLEVIDAELCEDSVSTPILADLGYSHPGYRTQRKVNIYRFLCPLDRQLLLLGTTAAWQTQQAAALLQFLENAMPEATRGIASLYLQLQQYLPDGQVQCRALQERLQWWIDEIDAERFREHIAKAINTRRISGEAVWRAIVQNKGKGSAAMQLNLLLGYEQQKDGIPAENLAQYYSSKGVLLRELARWDEAEYYLREALAILERTEGPDHPQVATGLNNLASLLEATNRLSEAEPLYRRALSIYETSYGKTVGVFE